MMMSRFTGRSGFERAIFQEHPSAMLIWDRRTLRILDANDAALALYGYSKAEFLQSTIDRVASLEHLGAGASEGYVRHRTKAAQSLRVQVWNRATTYRGIEATLTIAYELGGLLDARERLSDIESSLELVQRLAHVGTFSIDRVAGTRAWSDEIYHILGLDAGTAPQLDGFWAFADPRDAGDVRSEILRARSEHRPYSVDYRILRPDGSTRVVNEQGQWNYDDRAEWCFLSGTFQDITEREHAQTAIRHLAYHDTLTNLLNRAGLKARMQSVLESNPPEKLTAVILFDIDRFKTINDTLGHQAGDDVLVAIADRLRGRLLENELLARTGGDEFVTVIPNCADQLNISLRAEQLLQAFRTPFLVGSFPYAISASVGISVAPLDSSGADDLLRSADVAMYQSKSYGRNRFHYYTEQMHSAATRRFDLERGLRRGLDQNEFSMHYQPIVSAKDGGVRSVEALLRWHNHEMQAIPPGDFIEFAEETGVIEEIGDWVFDTTFAQAKRWADESVPLRIWVNVSAVQLHEGLPDKVRALLAKHSVDPDWIGFELTESSFINAGAQTLAIIQEIKSLGIRLALDDFGVKYSSLEYLQRLPIDTVKIDRVFVSGVTANRVNRAIIQAVVNIAHEMHLNVSAEGIETQAELDTIRSLGCDSWQGFFFSTARAANEVRTLVKTMKEAV